MARDWKSRQALKPTSITEIARRYHAAAVALAPTLGLPVAEVLAQHRESVTAIFIECGKCEVRLPAGVKLPPLAPTNGQGAPAPNDAPEGDNPLPAAGPSEPSAPNDAPEGELLPTGQTRPTHP